MTVTPAAVDAALSISIMSASRNFASHRLTRFSSQPQAWARNRVEAATCPRRTATRRPSTVHAPSAYRASEISHSQVRRWQNGSRPVGANIGCAIHPRCIR
jgi:hypothetical protein